MEQDKEDLVISFGEKKGLGFGQHLILFFFFVGVPSGLILLLDRLIQGLIGGRLLPRGHPPSFPGLVLMLAATLFLSWIYVRGSLQTRNRKLRTKGKAVVLNKDCVKFVHDLLGDIKGVDDSEENDFITIHWKDIKTFSVEGSYEKEEEDDSKYQHSPRFRVELKDGRTYDFFRHELRSQEGKILDYVRSKVDLLESGSDK